MGAFEYRQAEEIRDAFARHGERFLFAIYAKISIPTNGGGAN